MRHKKTWLQNLLRYELRDGIKKLWPDFMPDAAFGSLCFALSKRLQREFDERVRWEKQKSFLEGFAQCRSCEVSDPARLQNFETLDFLSKKHAGIHEKTVAQVGPRN